MRSFIISLGLLMSCVCFGQNIVDFSGIITDNETGEPVSLANIVILRADSSFVVGSVTDSIGNFNISVKEASNVAYMLKISHACYENKIVTVSSNDSHFFCIKLVPNNYILDNVEVTGIWTKVRNSLNMEYNVTDAMKGKCNRTTSLLEKIPSVFVDYDRNIYIKGSSRILILKNGQELHTPHLVDQIPPQSVKKVEINYSVPSRYAAKNYTAIMNIITEKQYGVSLLADTKLSADGRFYDVKANLGVERNRHSFYLFYQLYYRNLKAMSKIKTLITDTYGMTSDITDIKTEPRKELDNEFFYGYSFHPNENTQLGMDGYLSLYRENNVNDIGEIEYEPYSRLREKYNTQNYKIHVTHDCGLGKFQGGLIYNNVYVNDNDTYYDAGVDYIQQERREMYNAQAHWQRKNSGGLTFSAGMEYSHVINGGTYIVVGERQSGNYKGNVLTAYAESMFEVGEHFVIDAGINLHDYSRRFDNGTDVNAFNLYPRVSAAFSWNECSNLLVSYSSHISSPELWKLLPFRKVTAPKVCAIGNPYLKPEKTATLSVEYSYSKGSTYIASSVYFRQTKNVMLEAVRIHDDMTIITYENIEKRNDYGLDLTFSANLAKWWQINVYADAVWRKIPCNRHYKKNMLSVSGSMQSVWTITPRMAFALMYMPATKKLSFDGVSRQYESSLAMMSYSISKNMDLYLIFVQPLGNLNSYSRIYHDRGFWENRENIKAQRLLLSVEYNLSKGKNVSKRKLYENLEKKY